MSSQMGEDVATERDPSPATDRPDAPTTQEVFDVLSNRRRRYALYALERDGATTIGSLADRIAAWENDRPVDEVTSAERKRVYTALQQSHLPKLERTGLIDFDGETGRVDPTDSVGRMDVSFDADDEERFPWWQHYIGLSAGGCVVVAGVWLGVPPFSALPAVGWLALVVVLFAGSAVVHAHRSRVDADVGVDPPEIARRSDRTDR